ncbi:MAG TPA: rhomboid family intramembrane serine protease [Steroidobacteraceae bacterium]|jgi:membrane associated rhomboid family serine protease|nr:rhomboid family intramembrane serine protease [Steroidobacteraceae bacterium]
MFASVPPATRTLILINVGVFLLQQLAGPLVAELFALWPLGSPLFRPWQLVSYAFLHGSVLHIFFNMFALYMFGRALELYWGGRRFVLFYLVCVLTAALTQLVAQRGSGIEEEVIGASGGIFGILLAFAWYFPRQRIMLLFPPIPMPAWLFVTLYGLLELFFGVTGTEQGVAHFAHLGGMLGGALCILYWRARRPLGS